MKRVPVLCMIVALSTSILILPTIPVPNVPALAQSEVDCSQVTELGLDMAMGMRASLIRIQCGLEPGGDGGSLMSAPGPEIPGQSSNVNIITGPQSLPHVTHSESMIATKDGNNIVVAYNDSTGAASSPPNYSGVSVSFDGGYSFQRILPSPFANPGGNFGDPVVVYNKKFGKFYAGWLTGGGPCGGGIRIWESTNGLTWIPSSCAHVGTFDDRESMWVDNNSGSPNYGKMYVSYNNFGLFGAPLQVVTSSTVCPTCWSAPITLTPPGVFRRNVQLTGSPGTDGTVFLAAMNENGGQFNPRQNIIFRSLTGGVTWVSVYTGPFFAAPGDSLCATGSYFSRVDPIWRFLGWGQPAVGPAGVVHYAFAARSGISDPGDIYYIRSASNGDPGTWTPGVGIQLNMDPSGGGIEHWMPSVAATAIGKVVVSWYDRRNTTDGVDYDYYGIASYDAGLTWSVLNEYPVTDITVAQPAQPDPLVQACYAGDYNYHIAFGDNVYMTWTDGRVPIVGVQVQDVFFDQVFPFFP